MRPCDIMAQFDPELVAFTLSSNPKFDYLRLMSGVRYFLEAFDKLILVILFASIP